MNRIFFAASILLIGSAAAPALADDILVSGEIPVSCSVTAPGDKTNLDLSNGNAQAVGAVNVKCNSYSGFDATITSTNNGALVSDASPSRYSYAVNYGAGPINLTTPHTAMARQGGDAASIAAAASAAGKDYNLVIENISTTDIPYAGVYADTLTFTITAH